MTLPELLYYPSDWMETALLQFNYQIRHKYILIELLLCRLFNDILLMCRLYAVLCICRLLCKISAFLLEGKELMLA
jgi:hypothetical protein